MSADHLNSSTEAATRVVCARSRGYREAEGSVVVPGLELLAEIAQSARLAGAAARQRGGGDGRAELRARVLLLARGQAIPPGVVADRVVVGSDEVVKKARRAPLTQRRSPLSLLPHAARSSRGRAWPHPRSFIRRHPVCFQPRASAPSPSSTAQPSPSRRLRRRACSAHAAFAPDRSTACSE